MKNETILTLQKSNSRKIEGGGFILFGRLPEASLTFRGRPSNWLERWFPTTEKAIQYAERRGYNIEVKA